MLAVTYSCGHQTREKIGLLFSGTKVSWHKINHKGGFVSVNCMLNLSPHQNINLGGGVCVQWNSPFPQEVKKALHPSSFLVSHTSKNPHSVGHRAVRQLSRDCVSPGKQLHPARQRSRTGGCWELIMAYNSGRSRNFVTEQELVLLRSSRHRNGRELKIHPTPPLVWCIHML